MRQPVAELLRNGGLIVFALVIVFGYICYSTSDTTLVTQRQAVVPSKSRMRGIGFTSDYDTNTVVGGNPHPKPTTSTQSTGMKDVVPSDKTTRDQGDWSNGHILVYSSFEEQTNGARNLWQLQMWAKTLKMKVVEPFAVQSMFGVIGALPNYNQALRFSDYHDIEKWNKMVIDYGGSSLVQWENFLSGAPRKVILLYMLLRQVPEPIVVSYGEDDVKNYRPGKYEYIPPNDLLWLKQYFNVARVVTFIRNGRKDYPMTLEELNSYVFGEFDPAEVTLVIVNWVGMNTGRWRIQMKTTLESSFINSLRIDFHNPQSSPEISPSRRVLKAYENYVAQYIGNRKYIGIVFRTHCVLRFGIKQADFSVKSEYLLNCSTQLKHTLDRVRDKWGIFMAYDLGTFGSDGYFTPEDRRLFPLRDQIFLDVFNGSILMKEREEMLINAAGGISDRGFIAILEKTIATRADCIILLGKSSSFVESSASLYFSLHPSNTCAVSICSENFYNVHKTESTTNDIPDRFLLG